MAYRGRTQHDLYDRTGSYGQWGGGESSSFKGNSRGSEAWKGVVSGLVAGAAATWVMTQYQVHAPKLAKQVEQRVGGDIEQPVKQHVESAGNTTVKVANKVSQAVRGADIPEEKRQFAGNAVHFGFGTLNGALYGLLSEAVGLPPGTRGLVYGAGLWAAADEIALPALGLAKWWPEYPTSVHLNGLSAHLVYGATLDVVHRGIRAALGHGGTEAIREASTEFHAPRVHPRRSETANWSTRRVSRFGADVFGEEEQPRSEPEFSGAEAFAAEEPGEEREPSLWRDLFSRAQRLRDRFKGERGLFGKEEKGLFSKRGGRFGKAERGLFGKGERTGSRRRRWAA